MIGVIGAGTWGTSFSTVIANRSDVMLFARDEEVVNSINSLHENLKYLKGIKLPLNVFATSDRKLISKIEDVVFSVPVQSIRQVIDDFRPFFKESVRILNLGKGIEISTLKRVSEIFKELLPTSRYSVLSGPNFAREVALKEFCATVVASEHEDESEYWQKLLIYPYFRVYTTDDVVGVEISGGLKNVIAIAAGVVKGLKYGDNSKAALITRGLAEITRLGLKLGARQETFFGLSGVGDLLLSCTSFQSRNFRAGVLLAEGYSLDDIKKRLGSIIEGIYTSEAAFKLSKKLGVDMPIAQQVFAIINKEASIKDAIDLLTSRKPLKEFY
ncbi:glycerol 3-phosphate dehydrogenase (NAD(P)+) [Thermodesulfobium acidiphilum]|uniref:Glycerol-3-phosphate dehydrogenase [NAD(P)+] n=1 Tax=Thermodesulfobium acidiphilum TaxID=1794699 RepID=A0A2R4VYD3_THEAF|nr:NAD(P)H-dependent glycerol-3-phosphate dehydrogenase [Thermodesulfobium acidiphilum]AWB09502.1 glycerol 3-phosphate dehydrogenase (NAD(P)+) [Thermodesulfobium acidiphilum]PMP86607.1 MAG: glycerol-3-phosphate dehydrogenase [Thermodesulfobium narugense]